MTGGKNDEKGSGHGMAKVAGKHSLLTRPLQANKAGG